MLSAIKTKYPRLILHKLKSTCEYYYIANWFAKDNSFQKGKHETIQNFTPRQLAGFPYHGCHSQGFLKFPDFFLTSVKFSWPTELTISHIRPDDGLNPPLATISSTYLFMLSASQVQCTSGYSVAFGSTGCRGLAGRLMPQVKCWVPESQTSRGIRGAYILIFITGLSKMQFPAFSGMELVFRKGTFLSLSSDLMKGAKRYLFCSWKRCSQKHEKGTFFTVESDVVKSAKKVPF